MVGIRSHGSGTSGGNPNFRPPTEAIGPFDWAGGEVKIQSSVSTLQRDRSGRDLRYQSERYSQGQGIASVVNRPGRKVGTAH